MSNQIPILNLKAQYQQYASLLETAVLEVLRSGNYILGSNGLQLEKEIANLCGCQYGIGVANGTDALQLAIWALDLGPGDEVITTPFTFAATVEAILLLRAKPVFVDIDENSLNINADLIESAITPATKAILPVHLYGLPCAMDKIMSIAHKNNLYVIEDNAQAIGALYQGLPTGSFGNLACISFYPTKNLGACGDAGMIVTKDSKLADRLRALRAHGMRKRYFHDELGINSRLDEIQAAILLAKLPYLVTWNAARQKVAQMYDEAFAGSSQIIRPQLPIQSNGYNQTSTANQTSHVWHQYTVRVTNPNVATNPKDASNMRDFLAKRLAEVGIGSMCYYPVPLHLQQAFQQLGYKIGDFPQSEKVAQQVLSLPMYPELTVDQVSYIAQQVDKILSPTYISSAHDYSTLNELANFTPISSS